MLRMFVKNMLLIFYGMSGLIIVLVFFNICDKLWRFKLILLYLLVNVCFVKMIDKYCLLSKKFILIVVEVVEIIKCVLVFMKLEIIFISCVIIFIFCNNFFI